MQMTTVCRHLPRKSRIINAVKHAAITASLSTPSTDARTKIDWSNSGLMCRSAGRVVRSCGKVSRTPLTMARVDALPVL